MVWDVEPTTMTDSNVEQEPLEKQVVGSRDRRVALGPVTATCHMLKRLSDRGISREEILEALGDDPLAAPKVPTTGEADLSSSRLWRIGDQAGRNTVPSKSASPDHKAVLLGLTESGRPLHFVVVQPWDNSGRPSRRPELITIWDPSAEENRKFWMEDFAGPTVAGEYRVPRTTWYRKEQLLVPADQS